jgi:hypothetical protein
MNKNHLIGTKELTYDNAHKMKLEYFLISEDRERTRSLYGIRIRKTVDARQVETETTPALSASRDFVEQMIYKLMVNTVTPMTLYEVVDDLIG